MLIKYPTRVQKFFSVKSYGWYYSAPLITVFTDVFVSLNSFAGAVRTLLSHREPVNGPLPIINLIEAGELA